MADFGIAVSLNAVDTREHVKMHKVYNTTNLLRTYLDVPYVAEP